jgi:trehalose 6-phosphate phosphatase
MSVARAREESLADLLAPLRADPGSAGVLCDIDGTLAPIVTDPSEAAVPPETRDLLEQVAERYALVACVSGRRALEARRMVGVDRIAYAGNHGFELLAPGGTEPALDPAVGRRADAARAFAAALDAQELFRAGLTLEDKGPIQAFHWRRAADRDAAAARTRELAAEARQAGLVTRWGRMVLELRPIAGIDKGSATTRLVRDAGVTVALFGGDDETDLDAFLALQWLERAGRLERGVRIGIASDEEPEGLAERTDAVVEGPEGFLAVLRLLVESAG